MLFRKKPEVKAKKLWETYFRALLKQDFKKALSSLNTLDELEPNSSQVHLKTGDLLHRMGDTPGAVAAYHQASGLLINEGYGHKAIAIYKLLLRIEPNDKEATDKMQELLAKAESSRVPPAAEPEKMPKPEAATVPEAASLPGQQEALEEVAAPEWIPEETPAPEQWGAPEEAQAPEQAPEEIIAPEWPLDETPAAEKQEASEEAPLHQIFSSLGKEEVRDLFDKAATSSFKAGETVVEEGDSGDSMFVIKSGRAEVISSMGEKTYKLASLSEGDIFGEVGFLTGRPRTASVAAVSDLEVLHINRALLQETMDNNPGFMDSLVQFYYTRVQDTIKKIKR